MSSFPTRIGSQSFPTYSNKLGKPPANPEKEMDARDMNRLVRAAIGAGMTTPLAWASVSSAGALVQSGEAWDHDGSIVPVVTSPGAGVYLITYLSSYHDIDGNLVAIDFCGAVVSPSSAVAVGAPTWERVSAYEIRVRTFNLAGAATSMAFHVGIY